MVASLTDLQKVRYQRPGYNQQRMVQQVREDREHHCNIEIKAQNNFLITHSQIVKYSEIFCSKQSQNLVPVCNLQYIEVSLHKKTR